MISNNKSNSRVYIISFVKGSHILYCTTVITTILPISITLTIVYSVYVILYNVYIHYIL